LTVLTCDTPSPDENLCGLNYQMKKETVKLIIDILSVAQSTYVRQLLILKDEIEHGIVEAKSNIEFLNILKAPYAELIECNDTVSIAKYLPKMIHLFRTIWLNAPYYNTHGRIIILFTALSNQIVVMCKNFMDLNDVFAGKTRKSMKMLNNCIKLCEEYRSLYDKVSRSERNVCNACYLPIAVSFIT